MARAREAEREENYEPRLLDPPLLHAAGVQHWLASSCCFETRVVRASVVFFLVRLSWGATWSELGFFWLICEESDMGWLGFFWLLGAESGASECHLLPGVPLTRCQAEQSLEFLRDLGALAVRARGMVCKRIQLGVPSFFREAIFRDFARFFGSPPMTHSCESSRARVAQFSSCGVDIHTHCLTASQPTTSKQQQATNKHTNQHQPTDRPTDRPTPTTTNQPPKNQRTKEPTNQRPRTNTHTTNNCIRQQQ